MKPIEDEYSFADLCNIWLELSLISDRQYGNLQKATDIWKTNRNSKQADKSQARLRELKDVRMSGLTMNT